MKISIWAVGIIVALNNAGYDVGAMIAALGIGGLALAMAAKDTVSNIFGGFTIFTDRPFSLNDRVKVAGFDGTIKEIGIRQAIGATKRDVILQFLTEATLLSFSGGLIGIILGLIFLFEGEPDMYDVLMQKKDAYIEEHGDG